MCSHQAPLGACSRREQQRGHPSLGPQLPQPQALVPTVMLQQSSPELLQVLLVPLWNEIVAERKAATQEQLPGVPKLEHLRWAPRRSGKDISSPCLMNPSEVYKPTG